MFNLIPKEVRFFDYFEQQSQHIIRAAALLHEMVHHFADARAKAHAIKEVEHQGDHTTHEIIKKLNTTFITPPCALRVAPFGLRSAQCGISVMCRPQISISVLSTAAKS